MITLSKTPHTSCRPSRVLRAPLVLSDGERSEPGAVEAFRRENLAQCGNSSVLADAARYTTRITGEFSVMTEHVPFLPRLLISVRSVEEAEIALEGGAGIIDIKEPASGVLGAASLEVIRDIVESVGGRRPVSATIGDVPLNEAFAATEATAATGVDYVKIGAFAGGDPVACLMALKPLVERGAKLILVMFADLEPDFGLIKVAADAGFQGVMLDTAHKGQGNLCTVLSDEQLRVFLAEAHAARVMAGLAGSLRLDDIALLMPLRPDVLGFRGAACTNGTREQELDAAAVSTLWYAISQAAVNGEDSGDGDYFSLQESRFDGP